MKLIIIQEYSRHAGNVEYRECLSLKRAFEFHNYQADVWGLGHSNYQSVPDWESYDLIINIENYDEIGWVPNLSNVKTTKFLWSIDAHCKGIDSYLNTFVNGKYDLILQSTPEFMDNNSVWFPNAYDDDLIKPLNLSKIYDIGFCGTINNRGGLINLLSNNFKFKLDERILGDNMVKSINSYKIHFNANISIDINYRNFETLGCGTCLLTSYNKYYEALGMKDDVNCMVYSSVDELIDKTKYLLKNDSKREEIQNAGLKLAQYHTYKQRVNIIKQIMNI
jgi:hypothetical protein